MIGGKQRDAFVHSTAGRDGGKSAFGLRGKKKTARRRGRAVPEKGMSSALRDRLRNFGGEFDRARMIAFNAVQLVASL
jgi:hypothetical protein